METFSALLAFCEGNPPVTGWFPSQRPVMRSFDLWSNLNKELSKQSGRRWLEKPSRSLWSHCDEKRDVDGIHHMTAMASQTTCNLTLCATGGWGDNKENIKDHITRLLWQPLTKGQHCGKRFHVMTSLDNYLNDVAGTLIRTMLTVKMPVILIPGFLQI